MKTDEAGFTTAAISINGVNWSLGLVNKVRIENVELVTLYNLWRGVVMIIVGLIVFVPLIPCVNPIEILGFPWPIFVVPPINLHSNEEEKFTAYINFSSKLTLNLK